MLKKETRGVAQQIFRPLLYDETIYNEISNFRLPFSIFKRSATYKEVRDYLQEEQIINTIEFQPTRNDIFPNISILVKTIDGTFSGAATTYTNKISETLSKSIGEGLERFLLTKTGNSEVKLRKFSLNAAELAHLERFPKFLTDQSAALYNKKKQETDVSCLQVTGYSTRSAQWLPVQYVFWKENLPHEKKLVNSTTNGAGGHFKRGDAIVAGLCEEIERDTFLLYWLSKKTPEKIDLKSIKTAETKKIINSLTEKGIVVHILHLRNEFDIPVFVAVLLDTRDEMHALSIGAGVKPLSAEQAVYTALIEAQSVLGFSLSFTQNRLNLDDERIPFSDTSITRTERITMWYGKTIQEKISFFISGAYIPITKVQDLPAQEAKDLIEKITQRLTKKGVSDILIYDVRSKHLRRLGYHVVKVIVPEFLQMYLAEPLATLHSPRLAKFLNKKIENISIKDVNPLPHPFP